MVRSEAWKLIDQIIDAHINRLKSIDELDLNVDSVALKINVESRKKAADTLHNILQEIRGYGVQEKSVSPITRSMK